MFPHHWCAASCAATVKGALPVFSCRVRKPIPSENVMSVGNPCAYVGSAGNSESFSSFHGYSRNHSE